VPEFSIAGERHVHSASAESLTLDSVVIDMAGLFFSERALVRRGGS
jgi:hypothetical protein